MTIRFANGSSASGIELSRQDGRIRCAVEGCDDAVDFSCVNGKWCSAEGEPVEVHFAWEQTARAHIVTEADCICSPELAAELIGLLYEECEEPEIHFVPARAMAMGASSFVI